MVTTTWTSFVAAHLCLLIGVHAAPAACDDTSPDPATIAAAVENSTVRVQYTLRHDKGEAPYGGGWTYLCANCGNWHSQDLDDLIAEERVAERSGFVLSATTVITADPLIDPRFVERIAIRQGDELIAARPAAFGVDQPAMLLELDRPLTKAEPLRFDAAQTGPLFAVTFQEQNGVWTTSVNLFTQQLHVARDGRRFHSTPTSCVLVGAEGFAAGISMSSEVPADDSWKGDPRDWPWLSLAELDALHGRVDRLADEVVVRVSLSLRSPKQSDQSDPYGYNGDGDAATERNEAGVMIDGGRVLVLAMLKPKVTARLERITVHTPDGQKLPATFVGSLRDYAGFVAELDQPRSLSPTLSRADLTRMRFALLPSAEVTIPGEARIAYYNHQRIRSFEVGWKGRLYPSVGASQGNEFVFDRDGRLVALPIARRPKVSVEDRWGGAWPVMTSSAYLADVFDDLEGNIDPGNVPLSAEEENRLAWLGVELQPLDTELARANEISDQTNDGAMGALVTYVYEGSPAAEAGLDLGDVLLRMHVADHPKPIDIQLVDEYMWAYQAFPWDQLDEIPDEYFDQIPRPWPSAENTLNRLLTDLGFDTEYQLEVWRDGQVIELSMAVSESPAHFDSAKRHKSEGIGVTVRDLTYEVRRYFQRAPDEPGLIVSRIEPGSKASVAGLRPFEIITHVNDQPVQTAADFEQRISAGGELRMAVKRMTRGRIVKVSIAAGDDEQETGPNAKRRDNT